MIEIKEQSPLQINQNDYVWIGINRLFLKRNDNNHVNSICTLCHEVVGRKNEFYSVDGDERVYCSRKCALSALKTAKKDYLKNVGEPLKGFGISRFKGVRIH